MLQTVDLKYSYDNRQTLRFPDLALEKGEHWLMLGQSGSGKTTLLHLIGGLLSPESGQIRIGDTALEKLKGRALDHFRGRHIGIIFQKAHFIRSLNVEENLLLAQKLAGAKPDRNRIAEVLERLGLGDKLRSKTDRLSMGEQQRVAIARVLVNQPILILADEPTSALDDHNALEVANLLEELANNAGATLLLVTHDTRLKSRFPKQIQL
ncbi:MAG: ABC transporter ATP-binding protein [Haliscomenobacter sp.]|nr:ABC transporter ATP-binding protein [Haliscomenobacter sp.]MBK7477131.1 ABC transporter ATP-binding protein [Haliscomenobacter sp.]MBK8878624.1 ABC transporter ATP-binding protein [Haliscomenobacter sp.]